MGLFLPGVSMPFFIFKGILSDVHKMVGIKLYPDTKESYFSQLVKDANRTVRVNFKGRAAEFTEKSFDSSKLQRLSFAQGDTDGGSILGHLLQASAEPRPKDALRIAYIDDNGALCAFSLGFYNDGAEYGENVEHPAYAAMITRNTLADLTERETIFIISDKSLTRDKDKGSFKTSTDIDKILESLGSVELLNLVRPIISPDGTRLNLDVFHEVEARINIRRNNLDDKDLKYDSWFALTKLSEQLIAPDNHNANDFLKYCKSLIGKDLNFFEDQIFTRNIMILVDEITEHAQWQYMPILDKVTFYDVVDYCLTLNTSKDLSAIKAKYLEKKESLLSGIASDEERVKISSQASAAGSGMLSNMAAYQINLDEFKSQLALLNSLSTYAGEGSQEWSDETFFNWRESLVDMGKQAYAEGKKLIMILESQARNPQNLENITKVLSVCSQILPSHVLKHSKVVLDNLNLWLLGNELEAMFPELSQQIHIMAGFNFPREVLAIKFRKEFIKQYEPELEQKQVEAAVEIPLKKRLFHEIMSILAQREQSWYPNDTKDLRIILDALSESNTAKLVILSTIKLESPTLKHINFMVNAFGKIELLNNQILELTTRFDGQELPIPSLLHGIQKGMAQLDDTTTKRLAEYETILHIYQDLVNSDTDDYLPKLEALIAFNSSDPFLMTAISQLNPTSIEEFFINKAVISQLSVGQIESSASKPNAQQEEIVKRYRNFPFPKCEFDAEKQLHASVDNLFQHTMLREDSKIVLTCMTCYEELIKDPMSEEKKEAFDNSLLKISSIRLIDTSIIDTVESKLASGIGAMQCRQCLEGVQKILQDASQMPIKSTIEQSRVDLLNITLGQIKLRLGSSLSFSQLHFYLRAAEFCLNIARKQDEKASSGFQELYRRKATDPELFSYLNQLNDIHDKPHIITAFQKLDLLAPKYQALSPADSRFPAATVLFKNLQALCSDPKPEDSPLASLLSLSFHLLETPCTSDVDTCNRFEAISIAPQDAPISQAQRELANMRRKEILLEKFANMCRLIEQYPYLQVSFVENCKQDLDMPEGVAFIQDFQCRSIAKLDEFLTSYTKCLEGMKKPQSSLFSFFSKTKEHADSFERLSEVLLKDNKKLWSPIILHAKKLEQQNKPGAAAP
jgi:hypothetical protein